MNIWLPKSASTQPITSRLQHKSAHIRAPHAGDPSYRDRTPAEPLPCRTCDPNSGRFSPGRTLVEKFDTELFSDFSAKSSNFRRLVLSCINADFCVQILILQRFSRSTRFSHLCTARNSKSSQIFVKLFHIFAEIYVKIAIFSAIFIEFCTNFNENFSEFRWII